MEAAGEALVISLMALSGLIWLAGGRRLIARAPLLPRYERPEPDLSTAALWVAGLWIVLRLAALVEAWCAGKPSDATLESVQGSVVIYGAVYLVLLLALFSTARPASFGFRRTDLRGQVQDGIIGFLSSWLPVWLLLLATAGLGLRSPQTQHDFLRLLSRQPEPATIAWLAVAVGVSAPLLEELLFRVALQGNLAALIGRWPALGTAAILFCVVHGWPDMLPLLPLALVLGYIYEQRHSYVAVVIVHALFNLTMLAAQLMAPTDARPEVAPPVGPAPVAGAFRGSL